MSESASSGTAPAITMKQQLHLLVTGRVQGVSYRANAAAMAQRLGLCGWVRNLADGRVELLAQGDEKPLRSLLAWAHQGPAQARVEHVEAHWAEPAPPLESFSIRT
ncbi:MAG TPA: acylphosphatase [Moraxellaceae bacterium]|nr:acylphosphatase [Moraxellaceae bacterium]